MKTLTKNIGEISLFERENSGGRYVSNKCGRDFLYYALNYYYPEKFNSISNNPTEIDKKKLFGTPVPAWLAGTMIQFRNVPKFLRTQNLQLSINGGKINSFGSFINAILFSRKSYPDAIREAQETVDNNIVSGIDISLGLGGLLDHVMFVYGYDADNLYVIDTHKVECLDYKETETKLVFALSKKEIEKRWTRFGRVWKIKPL